MFIMNLNYAIVFCTIVDSGSISKAAEILHLTQPAVSIQLKELENSLQAKLVDRNYKGIKPTPAGKIVYDYGQRMLSLQQSLYSELCELNSKCVHLSIGSSLMYRFALPSFIAEFRETHPNLNIKLFYNNFESTIKGVRDNHLDIGLVTGSYSMVSQTADRKPYQFEILEQDSLHLAAANNSNWASFKKVDFEHLKLLPLVLLGKGSGVYDIIKAELAKEGHDISELNTVLEVNDINAAHSIIETGRACSLLPKIWLTNNSSLLPIKISDISFSTYHCLIYNKENIKKPTLEFLHAFKTELTPLVFKKTS